MGVRCPRSEYEWNGELELDAMPLVGVVKDDVVEHGRSPPLLLLGPLRWGVPRGVLPAENTIVSRWVEDDTAEAEQSPLVLVPEVTSTAVLDRLLTHGSVLPVLRLLVMLLLLLLGKGFNDGEKEKVGILGNCP